MPGLTYFNGTSISPINIWQPFPRLDTNYGYNYQGKALYHELVFKRRRAGCKEAGLDFIPDATVDNGICDNDPQGLAMRLALAQQKPYYYNRPWFKELDEYYTAEGTKQAQLADLIVENSKKPIFTYPELSDTNYMIIPSSATVDNYYDASTGIFTAKDCAYWRNNYQYSDRADKLDSGSLVVQLRCRFNNSSTTSFDIIRSTAIKRPGSSMSNPLKLQYFGSNNRLYLYLNSSSGYAGYFFNFTDSIPVDTWITIYIEFNADTEERICYYTLDGNTEKIYATNSGATFTNKTVQIQFGYDIYFDAPNDITGNFSIDYDLSTFRIQLKDAVYIEPIQGSIVGYNSITDSEFYNGYQLDYDTYAEALDEPL